MTVERSGTLAVPRPWVDVWNALPMALQQAGMRVEWGDPSRGLVSASAPMSLRSWGERVEIWCVQGAGGGTEISVRSASKVPMTIVDWGKSTKNVTGVLDAIGAALGIVPAGWYPDPADPSRQRWWDGSAWAPPS